MSICVCNCMQVCTYNQLLFPKDRNLVFDVDIPCIGSTSKGPYNLKWGRGNKVNLDNELYGLVELGRTFLQVRTVNSALLMCTPARALLIYSLSLVHYSSTEQPP